VKINVLMAWASKGKMPIPWIETLTYRERELYLKELERVLKEEAEEHEKAMGKYKS